MHPTITVHRLVLVATLRHWQLVYVTAPEPHAVWWWCRQTGPIVTVGRA